MHGLRVSVERIEGHCNLPMLVGDGFTVDSRGRLYLPPGRPMCLWALQSLLPMLVLMQRTDPREGDWSSRGRQTLVCPDPRGGVHYRIEKVPAP
jgi:uncharacterized repeat protein (TIGR04076 family)